MRGAEVPLRAPPPHPQARPQRWGRESERKETVSPTSALQAQDRQPPPRNAPVAPLLFPSPLILLIVKFLG